jgi:hypothetical protein
VLIKVTSYVKGMNVLECVIKDKLQDDMSTTTEKKDLEILLDKVNILKLKSAQPAQPAQQGNKK